MTRVLHIAWISNVDSAIYEFLNDLARRRVAVAQWFSEVRFLTKIQNFFLCPMLVTRQKDNFRYFFTRAQNLLSYSMARPAKS